LVPIDDQQVIIDNRGGHILWGSGVRWLLELKGAGSSAVESTEPEGAHLDIDRIVPIHSSFGSVLEFEHVSHPLCHSVIFPSIVGCLRLDVMSINEHRVLELSATNHVCITTIVGPRNRVASSSLR